MINEWSLEVFTCCARIRYPMAEGCVLGISPNNLLHQYYWGLI
jgi:hypothetical protein